MAKEALSDDFDISLADIYWPGAAPIALHVEAFEGRVKAPVGSKTFVMRGQLLGGHWGAARREGREWAWATKEEAEVLLAPRYYASIRSALSH